MTASRSVVHVVPGLGYGGTEFVVLRLAEAERARGWDSRVVSLKRSGALFPAFEKAGVPARPLGPSDFRGPAPGTVVGWLYNGNLAAGALARFRPGTGLVWNLMQANLSAAVNRWPTRAAMRLGAALSAGRPDAVVCNSEAARTAHAAAGYAAAKMSVIPNGVDTELYRPSENARTGVGPVVIGHLARWDPQKDHATFVRAVGRLLRRGVDVRARLAGPGVTADNPDLTRWIAETGRPECFERLGALDQTVPFYQSLDVFCLSSVGESSPYALAEAMACGLPAAATDVGDCRAVLNDGDALAPAGDDDALSRALERWARLGPEERRRKGREARGRIVEHYSFRRMVDAYLDLYQTVAARRDGRG
ncbi:MAG TPA: glycosyltransferase [Elusimicrobiota bacterium]|nr:glycosyltransferase [Elusimicrobiota bacterium]